MNDPRQRGADFAELLHRIAISEGKVAVKVLAPRLGMTPDSLNARLYGRVAFSAEEIRLVLQMVGDRRIADYLLEGSPYVAVDRTRTGAGAADDARHGAALTVIEAAQLLDQVERALLDKILCHQDKVKILKEVHDVEVAISALRAKIAEHS